MVKVLPVSFPPQTRGLSVVLGEPSQGSPTPAQPWGSWGDGTKPPWPPARQHIAPSGAFTPSCSAGNPREVCRGFFQLDILELPGCWCSSRLSRLPAPPYKRRDKQKTNQWQQRRSRSLPPRTQKMARSSC